MKIFSFLVTIFIAITSLNAQIDLGLIAYYPFDDQTVLDATGTASNIGIVSGDSLGWGCGVSGIAANVGANTSIQFAGPISDEFDTEDFTISFYMKPIPRSGTMDIFSKRGDCSPEHAFAIRYIGFSNTLNVLLSENDNLSANISHNLPAGRCWYHIVVLRRGRTTVLYVDGEFAAERAATTRVDISNGASLNISNSPCKFNTDIPFEGVLDEIRVYNRAISEEDVMDLYFAPDQISNRDNERIFLGESVDIEITETCADNFLWTPADDVDDPMSDQPTITPSEAGIFTYQVEMIQGFCRAIDSLRISVVDPATLDCNLIFLPSAFTPNGNGPIDNETYGISNSEAIQDLVSFEIFDRWGSAVFSTTDKTATWDGFFKNQAVNPGVYLYKVTYFCDGEEQIKAGSLTLIR
ncbi:MAG: LamG-like jellyroll fold domain-containing protein [Saprospiraceae bacterium]